MLIPVLLLWLYRGLLHRGPPTIDLRPAIPFLSIPYQLSVSSLLSRILRVIYVLPRILKSFGTRLAIFVNSSGGAVTVHDEVVGVGATAAGVAGSDFEAVDATGNVTIHSVGCGGAVGKFGVAGALTAIPEEFIGVVFAFI